MEILSAIDAFDDLVHEAPAVPLTGTVRIDAQAARDAVGRLRPAATEPFGLAPGVIGVIEELERMVASAPRVPLTEVVRIEPGRAYDLLGRLRELVTEARNASLPPASGEVLAVLAEIDAIDDLVHHAKRAAFSGDALLDETALRDGSARLRSAVGELTAPAGLLPAVAELDALVHAAKRTRTGRLRLPVEATFDVLDRLRAALASARPGL